MEQNAELIRKLSLFGPSEKGAQLYLNLLKYGPKTSGELAKSLDSYRVEVYRLLEKLTKIGLIEESLTKPVIFTAVPVEQALNSALIKHNSERASMKALLPGIVQEVNAFLYQQTHRIPDEARFKLVRGRREVYSAMRQVIQSAQREIAFVITANGLYQWTCFGLLDDCIACAKNGVDVRGIITTDVKTLNDAEQGEAGGVRIRHLVPYDGLRCLITDRQETLTPIVIRDDVFSLDTDDSAFWTTEREYAEHLMAVFEIVWDEAIDTSELTVETMSEDPSAVHTSASDEGTANTRQRDAK
ncbi:MAG: helix-turn-helix domain-containing protein [Halobacteriota archaeon]